MHSKYPNPVSNPILPEKCTTITITPTEGVSWSYVEHMTAEQAEARCESLINAGNKSAEFKQP